MTSVKKNFMYNIIYQIFIFIIPLITAPYLSRVVGVEGIGTYSYTYSIVYYFMLLTLLGVNNYGNRSIAKVRENKEKLSKTFWSIYLLQLFMGILMLFIYTLYILFFDIKYRNIAIIQALFIISAMFDINWLFFGLEEFKKTIIRNTIVKITNIILILIFVKEPNDLWKYTLIMGGMTCISQILLWPFLKNKVKFIKISFKDTFIHLKSNIILFIPVIAISLYKMMDKVMLGNFSNIKEVGLYENAEKIISIPLTFISALGTIMLPRISNIISKGEKDKISKYIDKSLNFVMFISFAMCFGLIGIGYHFAPFFFGSDFKKTGILIMLLAITLPFISFANVIRTQYLIPKEKDKIYIISVGLGALSNLIMNLILIPKYESIGACLGTILAEIIVMLYQCFAIRNEINLLKYLPKCFKFLIKAILMLLCILPLNFININSFIRLMLQVIIGGIIYILINFQYILSIFNIKSIKNILIPTSKKNLITNMNNNNNDNDNIHTNEEEN